MISSPPSRDRVPIVQDAGGNSWVDFPFSWLKWFSTLTTAATIKGGLLELPQYTTANAPAYAKGGMYFDTTLNKVRVGGATGYETITSV